MRGNNVRESEEKKPRTLAELSVTNWFTPENTRFYCKNHFLYVQFEDKDERAFLCRQFPFELQWEFISVMNEDGDELGIIRDVALFGDDARALLETELRRRYYSPVINRIISIKERYGFSYWRVHTAEGEISFTLQDTYRSIIRAGANRVIMMDVNGNRFEIPDTAALDRKSYKRIEIYL